jgi:hypothetical protein
VTVNTILGVPLGFGSITANQQGCQQTAQLATGSSQMVLSIQTDSISLLCDCSTCSPRPLILVSYRLAVFTTIHGLAQP